MAGFSWAELRRGFVALKTLSGFSVAFLTLSLVCTCFLYTPNYYFKDLFEFLFINTVWCSFRFTHSDSTLESNAWFWSEVTSTIPIPWFPIPPTFLWYLLVYSLWLRVCFLVCISHPTLCPFASLFGFLKFTCECNCMVFGICILWLTEFIEHKSFPLLPRHCKWLHFIPSDDPVMLQCVYLTHRLCPFICRWTSRLYTQFRCCW